jgi:hypothetical protein
MKKAKLLLNEWKNNPILEQDEDSKNTQKTERLESQKKQFAQVLKTLLEEGQAKLEEYYQDDESLSEDEFLNPEKPYLVTAIIQSVIEEHPEFTGTGNSEETSKEDKPKSEKDKPPEE